MNYREFGGGGASDPAIHIHSASKKRRSKLTCSLLLPVSSKMHQQCYYNGEGEDWLHDHVITQQWLTRTDWSSRPGVLKDLTYAWRTSSSIDPRVS